MSWSSKQEEILDQSWLYVTDFFGDEFNEACSPSSHCAEKVWKSRGEVFFSGGTFRASRWKHSGPKNSLNPKSSL